MVPAWGNNKASKRLKNLLVLEQKQEDGFLEPIEILTLFQRRFGGF